jgi:hypothetical protein
MENGLKNAKQVLYRQENLIVYDSIVENEYENKDEEVDQPSPNF